MCTGRHNVHTQVPAGSDTDTHTRFVFQMPMSCTECILVCILALAFAGIASSQHTRVPDHLKRCYRDPTLYDRGLRLPHNVDTMVEILRKLELTPGFNMDMRGLALSLLHMFRVDGVEKDPDAQLTSHTLPFTLKGFQYGRYRVLTSDLLPVSPYSFPNGSLTAAEECALHFMLSSSMDTAVRSDEDITCPIIANPPTRSRRQAVDSLADHDVTEGSDEVEMISITNGGSRWSPPPMEDMIMHADGDPQYQMPAGTPVRRQEYPVSRCPLENGVIATEWGTVNAGTLVAAIAAGLERQQVRVGDIASFSNRRRNVSRSGDLMVDNLWAATLAGDLAEVALRQGPKGAPTTVGAPGAWNSSAVPRWYFVDRPAEMTDAEIRGGIDGLILGTIAQSLQQRTGGALRLSDLVRRFYSNQGILHQKDGVERQYRACARQDMYAAVAPLETMQEQAYTFAVTLSGSSTDIVVIDEEGIHQYSEEAVRLLNDYVPTGVPSRCLAPFSDGIEVLRPEVDLLVVIDCSRPLDDTIALLGDIKARINHGTMGSNLTVVSGADFHVLVNNTNATHDIYINMHQQYSSCQHGMDLKGLFTQHLPAWYREDLAKEKNTSYSGGHSKVVLLVFNTGFAPSKTDLEAADNGVRNFWTNIPDVKFLYLLSGNRESFLSLAEDQESDIFTYTNSADINVSALVARISQVHRRIINAMCGADSKESSYQSQELSQFVAWRGINYYRIHPKYMFGVQSLTVKIRPAGSGNLQVCHSRQQKYPNGTKSSNNVQCKQVSSDGMRISLSQPCARYDHILQCPPLYISVQSVNSTSSGIWCTDKRCREFDDVAFTLEHTGLRCGSGCAMSSASVCALITAMILIFYSS